jgi:hypothetical protein
MALTRRLFLERLAGAAGATVTYDAMVGLGLLPEPAAKTAAFELRGAGEGITGLETVFIVGLANFNLVSGCYA